MAVNRAGGGRLVIPHGTYVVGRQGPVSGRHGAGHSYQPEPILEISGCRGQVEIVGDGASLVAANGLRFGSFDPVTGTHHEPASLPFTAYDYRADAYTGMVVLRENADVLIQGLDLNGNMDGLRLGGHWGDTGRQCRASGIHCDGNRRVTVEDVHTHHHGLDGLTLSHGGLIPGSPSTPQVLRRVRSDHNARQGLSYVGGIGLRATDCRFADTGMGRFGSGPGAGVDLEPERSVVRDARFVRCTFQNNAGPGLIADSGDSADVIVQDSVIWGSSKGPAVWPRKPGLTFERCAIFGWVVNAYGSSNAAEATRFLRCRFEDRTHPTNGAPQTGNALIQISGENILLQDCSVAAQRTRSLYLDDGSSREQLRRCTVTHAYDALPEGGFQALLRGTAVEQTAFREDFANPPADPYYIAHESVAVGAGVGVEGPYLTWGSGGPSGTIKQS
jgi:hypothetical protein